MEGEYKAVKKSLFSSVSFLPALLKCISQFPQGKEKPKP